MISSRSEQEDGQGRSSRSSASGVGDLGHGDAAFQQRRLEPRRHQPGLLVRHPDAGAGGERRPHVGDRGVEARRCDHRGPVRRSQPGPVAPPGDDVGQGAVLDHHALGAAGRTRGVDDVREVAGIHRHGRGAFEALVKSVERDDRQPGRDPVRPLRTGHRQQGAGVLAHVGEAVGGVLRVEREVGRPGAQDGQLGGDQIRSARQAGGDHRLRPGAAALELGGQDVGPGAQPGVGQLAAVPAHGRRLRRPAGPVRHGLVHGPLEGRPPGRRGSSAARSPPPPRRQQFEPADGAERIADHAGQQALELAGHARDRARLEEVAAVLELEAQPVRAPARTRPASGRTWTSRSRLPAGTR